MHAIMYSPSKKSAFIHPTNNFNYNELLVNFELTQVLDQHIQTWVIILVYLVLPNPQITKKIPCAR